MSASALPVLPEPTAATMPRVRAACLPGGVNAARPCPWTCCRHSLAAEDTVGACTLDVVDKHPDGLTHDAIGQLLGGITRERVRQIEAMALRKVAKRAQGRAAHAGYRELGLTPDEPPISVPGRR